MKQNEIKDYVRENLEWEIQGEKQNELAVLTKNIPELYAIITQLSMSYPDYEKLMEGGATFFESVVDMGAKLLMNQQLITVDKESQIGAFAFVTAKVIAKRELCNSFFQLFNMVFSWNKKDKPGLSFRHYKRATGAPFISLGKFDGNMCTIYSTSWTSEATNV